jgi:hypothetical protein
MSVWLAFICSTVWAGVVMWGWIISFCELIFSSVKCVNTIHWFQTSHLMQSVLHNMPYDCIQTDKLWPYALKRDMISWLHNKGISCNESMNTNDLYNSILPLKPKQKTYKMSGHGHTILWFNICVWHESIEHAWAKIKHIVRVKNYVGKGMEFFLMS